MKTELEKLEAVSERSQVIGEFLEWLFETKNCHIARYFTNEEYESDVNVWFDKSLSDDETSIKRHIVGEGELIPLHINIEKLLAEFFEIDLVKVEEERREILKEIK